MIIESFIAHRIAFKGGKQSFSKVIIRIAVVAVALSMTVMIVATSVINGFTHQIEEKIFGFWGHIHLTHVSGMDTQGLSEPVERYQEFYPHLDTIDKVAYQKPWSFLGVENENYVVQKTTNGGVRHIQVFAYKPGIFKTKEEIEGIVLKGVADDYDWDFFEQYLVEGSILEWNDSSASSGILLSQQTADRLKLKVGDRLLYYFEKGSDFLKRRFEVRGIYKTGLEDYDRQFALVDLRKVQGMNKWSETEVGGFEVFLDDIADLDIMTEYIYIEEMPGVMSAQNVRQTRQNIFEWLQLQDINEAVILILMLIVSIINMVTALMILILERTNMIGTLKALGQRSWSIRKIFLYHAAYIIGVGLLWGNIVGLTLCFLQQQYGIVELSEENYYLSTAPVEINWLTVVLLNIGTLVITLIFLIIPSWLVTRISPVKALRFK